jgi:hypothetical protein
MEEGEILLGVVSRNYGTERIEGTVVENVFKDCCYKGE